MGIEGFGRVRHELFLLLPHGEHGLQVRVIRFVLLQSVECLAQYLSHARIASMSQQILDCIGKVLVEVLGEGSSRVVGEDANEHYGIVLGMGASVILFGQKLADLGSGRRCCAGTCDGRLDDGGQVQDFLALDSRHGYYDRLDMWLDQAESYRVRCTGFTKESLLRSQFEVLLPSGHDGSTKSGDSPPPLRHWPRACRHYRRQEKHRQ